MSRLIPGFDYRSGKAVERTRAEWRADLKEVLAAGGWRRVEAGETFAHMLTRDRVTGAQRPSTVFEVYATLPA